MFRFFGLCFVVITSPVLVNLLFYFFRLASLVVDNCRTGEFPTQMASYAENVSIWWRHHGFDGSFVACLNTLYASIVSRPVKWDARIMLMWCQPHNRYPIAHLWGHNIECQKSWGPFHKCFCYSNLMENMFCHNSILSHEIATKFCSHNNNNNTTVIKNSMPTSSALFFREFKPHPWKKQVIYYTQFCISGKTNKSSQWLPNTPFASISECLVS